MEGSVQRVGAPLVVLRGAGLRAPAGRASRPRSCLACLPPRGTVLLTWRFYGSRGGPVAPPGRVSLKGKSSRRREGLRCVCCSVSVSVAIFPRATQPALGRGCLPEPRSSRVSHVAPECSSPAASGELPGSPLPAQTSLRWEGEALEVRPGLSPSFWLSGDPSPAQALWAPCSPPTVQTHLSA